MPVVMKWGWLKWFSLSLLAAVVTAANAGASWCCRWLEGESERLEAPEYLVFMRKEDLRRRCVVIARSLCILETGNTRGLEDYLRHQLGTLHEEAAEAGRPDGEPPIEEMMEEGEDYLRSFREGEAGAELRRLRAAEALAWSREGDGEFRPPLDDLD